ncbi:hypothetical protein J2X16_004015 [Pelomonas aquatica]|uniref:TniQ domain-containing protein n=1 Tax=Pelomonas aquatica TaxID=431058 RepID=A0ABU1ZDF5_9BURK|nr:TniQ family protein [Pelomonas aquatica]MDR7298652.1 hypothetical protein [Pelomonas aquatica]
MSLQIPILPEGSMLYSALAFCYRASAASNGRQFVDKFYGNRGASHLNWFGAGAAFVSSQAFNDAASPVEILRRHTLFGYYSLGLGVEAALEWAAALAKGNARGSVRYTRTLDPIATKAGLRCCKRCVAEDEAKGGLATWRLVHQLPFVQHCPAHLESLVEQCPRCDVPLDNGRKFRLPGEPCSSCGSPGVSLARMRPSTGYFRLLTRADEALHDQVDIYRPVAWTNAVRVFGAFYNSPNLAAEALSHQLCSLWATESVGQLWEQLGLKLRSDDLMQAISGTVVSSPLTLQLVTAEAMQALHPEIFAEQPPVAAAAPSATPEGHLESHRSALLRSGAAIGLNPSFLEALVKSGSPSAAAAAVGFSKEMTQVALTALSASIRTEFGKAAGAAILDSMSEQFSLADRQERSRTRVLMLLADEPGVSRGTMWKRLRHDMRLLTTEDESWLEQTIPARFAAVRPWANVAERTEFYRMKVRDALAEDPVPTRTVLRARLPKVMAWLGVHDKVWLEKALPARQRRKRSTS